MPRVEHDAESLRELSVFGWMPGGRPILAQQWAGADACQKCNGFGTYGMPLCGALYTCTACKGSGRAARLQAFWKRLGMAMNEALEFVCPECESRDEPRLDRTGQCRSCGHSWLRAQDYVYFVVRKRFKSPQEYQRYVAGSTRRLRVISTYAIGMAFAFTVSFWLMWWLR